METHNTFKGIRDALLVWAACGLGLAVLLVVVAVRVAS